MGFRITVTPKSILLYAGDSERPRVEEIDGAAWNGDEGRWHFPNGEEMLEKLIAEFGEDLDEFNYEAGDAVIEAGKNNTEATSDEGVGEAAPPQHIVTSTAIDLLTSSVSSLCDQVAGFPSVEEIHVAVGSGIEIVQADIKELQARLTTLMESQSPDNAAAEALKRRDEDLAAERAKTFKLDQELKTRADELSKLRQSLIKVQEDTEWQKKYLMQNRVINLSKRLSGNDEEFCQILDSTSIEMFPQLPLVLAEKLKSRLSSLSSAHGIRNETRHRPGGTDLFDLLIDAKNRDILNSDAINAAHFLRMRRKGIAHPVKSDSGAVIADEEALALATGCIVAAAIVWESLGKYEENRRNTHNGNRR